MHDDPLQSEEWRKAFAEARKRPLPRRRPLDSIEGLTQIDVAGAFVERYAGDLRYCHDAGAWYWWRGDIWKRDRTEEVFHAITEIAAEFSAGLKPSELKEARRATFAAGVERIVRSSPALAVTSEAWDSDEMLLGTPAGTVDLESGEIRNPDAADGISRATAVAPAETIDCPKWLAFLHQATGGDRGVIRLLQQWCGYSLTGSTREQKFIFVWGKGNNGKSVFIATIGGIAGDYKVEAPMETFLATPTDRHPTELAFLHGARMVTATETDEGRAWNEQRIKTLTGGDQITARFMRRDFFTFTPQFSLTVVGNHKPILKSVGDAMRRRLILVPFNHKPAVVNGSLVAELRQEWPEILRWMIDGAIDWRMHGLVVPDSVVEATDGYFDSQDMMAAWLEEACIIDHGNEYRRENPSRLFDSWGAFAKRNNFNGGSVRSFGDMLEARGFPRLRTKAGRFHTGIELKATEVFG
jgi:putative DNA primase/helicase